MKIYIHTDLEGISGIDNIEIMSREHSRHREAVENLMADLNAAVDGAFLGGAEHVTVLDSHGGGGNFILEMLDKRAENDTKPNKKWWGILDESYDATFFIGAHAMAGTINGFLDHTQSSTSWYNYSVNGRKMGELAQWAMVAGHFGVPLVMMSGDEAACVEARQFFNPVETAIVKTGIGRNRAQLVELNEAHARIREAARRAVAIIPNARPFVPSKPMEIILEYTRSDYCDGAAASGAERIDARTVRKVTDNALELFP
jgi:D-amino peptidase